MASLSPCMSGLIEFGITVMPRNRNTFIERDLFKQLIF
jgi:hypothetical protein